MCRADLEQFAKEMKAYRTTKCFLRVQIEEGNNNSTGIGILKSTIELKRGADTTAHENGNKVKKN